MNYQIRQANPDDVLPALNLALRVFMEFEAPEYEQGAVSKFKADCVENKLYIENYTSNKQLMFIAVDNEDAWVFELFEKYRNKGVGGRLLKTSLRQLDTTREISVVTFRDDYLPGAPARAIYAKSGFADRELITNFADENEAEAIVATEDALREIAELDYKYVMNHSHPQIRQRIYHLQGTSEYLMIDFCWQLHSRPRNSYSYYENDQIEAVKVIFDKDSIIRYRPYDQSAFTTSNAALLEEMKYRYTQHSRVIKYVRRGLYPEAFAYYQRYVLEPLVCLLRILYTPAYTDYGFVHISKHIPKVSADRLTYFSQVSSFGDIEQKTAEAKDWLGELVERVKL